MLRFLLIAPRPPWDADFAGLEDGKGISVYDPEWAVMLKPPFAVSAPSPSGVLLPLSAG